MYGETMRTNFELKKFNWGAFGFTIIWGLLNGVIAFKNTFPIVYILCFSCYISIFMGKYGFYTSILTILGFMIYCGINGNQWAYSHRATEGLNNFVKTQKNWGAAYVAAVLLTGILLLKRFIH